MLVPTIVTIINLAQATICIYSWNFLCIAAYGISVSRSWDVFSDLNEAAALALGNSVQCDNTQVYFAGDPESGGHPIGRRSIAPDTGFRFRCRSWSSAR